MARCPNATRSLSVSDRVLPVATAAANWTSVAFVVDAECDEAQRFNQKDQPSFNLTFIHTVRGWFGSPRKGAAR